MCFLLKFNSTRKVTVCLLSFIPICAESGAVGIVILMKNGRKKQEQIHLGAHGEDYGNWMPVSMLRLVGGLAVLAAVLSLLSFSVFHITALGVVFVIDAILLLALLLWITWIRRRYAFEGGGMMEQVHQIVLSHLDFDGQGQLLDVGCGSGALSIRAVLMWPEAKVTGIDYWGADFGYNQTMCEKNAASEGVAAWRPSPRNCGTWDMRMYGSSTRPRRSSAPAGGRA